MADEQHDPTKERDRFLRDAMAHLDHLYSLAYYLAKRPEDAQDMVQETYTRALGAYKQFTPGTNMKAWLTRILYNFFYDHYAGKKRWLSVEDDLSFENERAAQWEKTSNNNPGPEGLFLQSELQTQITEALNQLPEKFRVPILLVDMGDLSYAEAAEILCCPVGTIRSRLSRSRRLLYKQLRDYVIDESKGDREK